MVWEMATQSCWKDAVDFRATILKVDHRAGIAMKSHSEGTLHMKQIDMKCHHVPELVSTGIVKLEKVRTTNQMVGILSKSARLDMTSKLVNHFGLDHTL